MKFSEEWLREWVNPNISTADLVEQLTMAGLEVDAVEPVAPIFQGVIVGKVLDVAPHPDADRLRICRVLIGQEQSLQIVCGAQNVAIGMRAPLALVGAQLPGAVTVKESTLRGVRSQGMLCSAKELGLAESSEGLLPLPSDAKAGDDLRDYLRLDDMSLELSVTPNRGDCLSVAGIAREVAILNRLDLHGPAVVPMVADIADVLRVDIQDTASCPLYIGRVVRGIDTTAMTPIWMKERLRRSGLRSIHPVVDVTNYVLLELGQPMHAFDLGTLKDGIVVRQAVDNEELHLLDGRVIHADGSTLVIADHHGPIALAGIMGGVSSAVGAKTRDLFLESAFFTPAALLGRARRYGVHTDSSHRFERGVDPQLARRAMERATALLLDIVGGRPGPVIERRDDAHLPVAPRIFLRLERIHRLLGANISVEVVQDILVRLGMEVKRQGQAWLVQVPDFRFDVRVEADLIEEVARIHGYAALPSRRPWAPLIMAEQPEEHVPVLRLCQTMVDRGYSEAVTYSFVDPRLQEAVDPQQQPITLANPISPELAVMRTSLWPGLLQALTYNHNRQQARVRLFEVGSRYGSVEERMIAGLAFGLPAPEQWAMSSRSVDFFDVKADVEALLMSGGQVTRFRFEVGTHPALHPGQTAAIFYDPEDILLGHMGVLHPVLVQRLDLPAAPVLFELKLALLRQASLPRFHELSRFPAIRRDLAVIVPEQVSSASLCTEIVREAGDLLQGLQLFDVYRGKGIDSGKKSLALGLTLQDTSRTLTDDEVERVIEKVLGQLKNKYDATLRE